MSLFLGEATAEIVEYLCLNTEWVGKDDLDEYKEKMLEELFNTELKFVNERQCRNAVQCIQDIFDLNEWTMCRAEDAGIELSTGLLDQFNTCWYLTGKQLIDEEWDDITKDIEISEPDTNKDE